MSLSRWCAMPRRPLLPLAALLLALAGCGSGSAPRAATTAPATAPAPGPVVPTTDLPASVDVGYVGEGADGAWVLRPSGAGRRRLPVVLFAHGWFATNPALYRGWVTHLVDAGNEVIYPTYQSPPYASPRTALRGLLAGVRTALADRDAPVDPLTLVAIGHSAGGALIADYAARAARERLPAPRALVAAYPGRMLPRLPDLRIPEVDPGAIPAPTRILALGGADDTTVGTAPARRLVARATRVPAARRAYVLVTDPDVDDHLGPQRDGADSQRTFWAPADALIKRARG